MESQKLLYVVIFKLIDTGLAFVFFYFMGLNTVNHLQLSPLQGQESLLEDEILMREISELVESPLSGGIYEIIEENGNGYDENFLDFVVPDFQDDFQS